MLTREENELLTHTNRGTPGGELLRRYWQPVALAEELPPGGAPIPVRLLGEDLVLFRDDQGRPGLLGLHCSHRGTDLSYGRVEDGGLRCPYHGWLYDVQGSCLEQPGEPAGSIFRDKIRHLAYPCQEVAEVLFAYLGPGEPPLLPAYELLLAPQMHQFRPIKNLIECNYLQGNEGNLDPSHTSYLHRLDLSAREQRRVPGTGVAHDALYTSDLAPLIETEVTAFGLRIYTLRRVSADDTYLRISNLIMPNACAIPGNTGADGYQIDWHVPIDDTQHWKYTMGFVRSAPLQERDRKALRAELTPDYRRRRNAGNRYLQDREEMRTRSYLGMGTVFQVHDAFAVESPGPIQDRTQEHLGYTDKAIIQGRHLLLQAIRDLEQGREPLHVVRDPRENQFDDLVVRAEVIRSSTPWQTYWQQPIPVP
jgi:phthalate 4,5-dioxygenase oxygenase subunit